MSGWERLRLLEQLVEREGACAMPGVSIRPELLVPLINRAVVRGFVSQEHANFVCHGLRYGFDLGVDIESLRGRQRFRNYPSALNARSFVSDAIQSRLGSEKTVCLGEFNIADRDGTVYRGGAGASFRSGRCQNRSSRTRCDRSVTIPGHG